MLLITIIFAYYWQQNKELANKYRSYIFMLLTFIPLFILNSGMYYVGTDYREYYKYFQRLSPTTTYHMDSGFEAMCKLLKYNGLSFQWIYLVTSLIGYVLLILCIRRYSKNYAESYFWYFAFTFMHVLGFNTIRQFVALLLVWYGVDYIREKSFIRYAVFVVLGASFHISAIVMLPFYFIFDKKLKLSFWLVVSVVSGSFYVFYSDILTWLFKTFKPSYLNSNYVSKELELDFSYVVCHLITVLIIFLYYKRAAEINSDVDIQGQQMKKRNLICINSVLVGNVINLCCMWLPIYKRFAIYFLMPSIWIIPNMLALEKNKKIKWTIILIQAASCLYYMSRYVGYWEVFPYRSVLEQWF